MQGRYPKDEYLHSPRRHLFWNFTNNSCLNEPLWATSLSPDSPLPQNRQRVFKKRYMTFHEPKSRNSELRNRQSISSRSHGWCPIAIYKGRAYELNRGAYHFWFDGSEANLPKIIAIFLFWTEKNLTYLNFPFSWQQVTSLTLQI